MNFAELNGKSIRDAFLEFDQKNPTLYEEFKKQAFRAINAGRKKISSKMIVNYLRWEIFIETSDINFKCNDAFTAMYARKFIADFPEHKDKFEIRKLRTEQSGPYMYVGPTGQISFV